MAAPIVAPQLRPNPESTVAEARNRRALRDSPTAAAALLWAGFLATYVWLTWWTLHAPNTPINDVSSSYRPWIEHGVAGHGWVGIDRVWVYPSAALVPMVFAAVQGFAHYERDWLAMVMVLFAVMIGVLTRGGTRRLRVGWWLLAFLLVLGPITLGRIDAVSLPFAVIGVLYIAKKPAVATVLLTIGAWVKVWPVAIVVAALVASSGRIRVLIAAASTSAAVVLTVLALGGTRQGLTGFVTQQAGRGLQLEAPVTTWWLWLEVAHVRHVRTYFDLGIVSYQTVGPGTALAAKLMTPIMAVVMLGIVLIGTTAIRRGASSAAVLGPLALGLTAAFIATNKVGSPQYESWLAAPVILGFLLSRENGTRFTFPAVLTLVIAGMTQVIFPWFYRALVAAQPWMIAFISVRNLLLIVLVGWCVVALVRLARPASELEVVPALALGE